MNFLSVIHIYLVIVVVGYLAPKPELGFDQPITPNSCVFGPFQCPKTRLCSKSLALLWSGKRQASISRRKNRALYHRADPTFGTTSNNLFMLLLVLSGDVESNPGPVKYPCGICSKPVRINQKGVACDTCSLWYLDAWV